MRKAYRIGIFVILMLSLFAGCVWAQSVQNVELHGYMLNRFYANPSSSARFVTERVSLSASGKIGTDTQGYVEVYFHPWMPSVVTADQYRTYLESAYLDIPLGAGRVRVGKGRQLNFGLTPTYGNRKTTQYGILSETFTQDRIVGAQYAYKKGAYDVGASLFTDQNLSTRGIGDFAGSTADDVVKHIVDKDVPADNSGKLAFSMRTGITKPCFQIHVSGATGALNPAQLTTLTAANAFNRVSTDTDHNKYGVDTIYSHGTFVAQAEWYKGQFSFLGIDGYSVLVGYQPKNTARAYLRYAALNNDVSPNANPITWNVQQLTLGVVQPIRPNVWAELNYERNTESAPSGLSELDNDMLFVEFFTGF